MEEVQYKNLLPREFKKRFEAYPLAYVPVGSLEWHGEHLCFGVDTVKVEAICEQAARKGGGIVLPGLFLGNRDMISWPDEYNMGNKGIFGIPSELLARIIEAQLENLDKLGFKGAIVITGHYPHSQVALVQNVAKAFSETHTLNVAGLTDRDLAQSVGHTGDHAAKWETTIMMHVHPTLVNMSRIEGDPVMHGIHGVDPRTSATPELGKIVVDVMVDELVALGKTLVG
jgi:creatinine amidohydrolase